MRRDGRRLRPDEPVKPGDVAVCGHSGCERIVCRLVLHPDCDDGTMTVEYIDHGHDYLYRDRCVGHAEPGPALSLF